ncbi:hypothetical protein JAAARDRAFT_62728 [Jaapia argillacea MUCL 33604]|uniref:Uncharacterized protein n=1 Tax=Jaapia argillacea MUCL 33604 TaxID=933084 RepID=A0A067P8B4_9AGAM|nr:hypothetical protein JAAARDRAFT_62728 [Jaapia argillacea MUCL 33604]
MELVERILCFAMETRGMTVILARVARFMYERAVKCLYPTIRITWFMRHKSLALAVKRNKRLAGLVKSIIVDMGGDGSSPREGSKSLVTILRAVAPNLRDLHILRNDDNYVDYGYSFIKIHSLLLDGHHTPPSYNLINSNLAHLIADGPHEFSHFSAKLCPSLAHVATFVMMPYPILWEEDTKPQLIAFINQPGSPLCYLVLILAHGTESTVIAELTPSVPDHIQLVIVLLPPAFSPYHEINDCDFRNLREKMSEAHFNGTLWDAKQCTAVGLFGGLEKHVQSPYRPPSPPHEYRTHR